MLTFVLLLGWLLVSTGLGLAVGQIIKDRDKR